MKVVILCGGHGTRIRDVSDNLPKPMISIGDYPIVWHIMKYYSSFGFNDFILCLGYKSHVIKNFFLNYETFSRDITIKFDRPEKTVNYYNSPDVEGWKITLAETGLDTMTGGRIRKIKKYIPKGESFLLTYGDGLCDLNINELIEFHKKSNVTMTLTGVRPPARFGELMSNANGIVTEFNEKPQATEGRISGGFFICNYNIFDYIKDKESVVFEQEPMKDLVSKKELAVFRHDGFWQCMDTYRDWQLLNNLYEKGQAPWKK
jgi:glucose-1-phosphate cytidylyltransferase